jgi:hypothetical protein
MHDPGAMTSYDFIVVGAGTTGPAQAAMIRGETGVEVT